MQQDQYRLMFELEDSHWWFLSKRLFIKSVLKSLPKKPIILDVGSGTGGTTKFLEHFGQVTSIEPSPYAHPFLRKRKIKFHSLKFAEYKSDKNFDLICFFDVLYHKNIESDIDYLKIANKLLKKGGRLIITDCALPFFYSIHDRVMEARERYLLPDMEQKLKNAGFKIIKSSYIYFLVFPLFAINRLLQKKMPLESVSKTSIVLNSILLNICRLETFLLKRTNFPFGSSFIIYAKKK